MQLEFHQLERRWEHLRVRHPARQRRLLASLAESGQQTPIVVVAAEGHEGRYVIIDGYKRIAAPNAPVPASAALTDRFFPSAELIAAEIRTLLAGR